MFVKFKSRLVIVFFAAVLSSISSHAQTISTSDINSISTAVPFLSIAPDTRATAMGEVGAATGADAYAMHYNPAKMAFSDEDLALSLTYSPWLRKLVDDMNLLYLSGYKRIEDRQYVGFSLRYFDMGTVTFRDNAGIELLTTSPNEFAIDAAYARRFTDYFSMAIALRYIRSDISMGVSSTAGKKAKAGNSFAADLAFNYQRPFDMGSKNAWWALGLNLSNIGTKMAYGNDRARSFLPTNFRFGGALGMHFDDYNSLLLSADVNKLLVPTPAVYDANGLVAGRPDDVSVITGIFQSFNDAPNGFSEELHEFTYGVGLEYLYRSIFALRTGYYYEHPTKGNRRYFTAGIGLKYRMLGIDLAYLISTQGQQSPLNNTIRVGLSFTMGKKGIIHYDD